MEWRCEPGQDAGLFAVECGRAHRCEGGDECETEDEDER